MDEEITILSFFLALIWDCKAAVYFMPKKKDFLPQSVESFSVYASLVSHERRENLGQELFGGENDSTIKCVFTFDFHRSPCYGKIPSIFDKKNILLFKILSTHGNKTSYPEVYVDLC